MESSPSAWMAPPDWTMGQTDRPLLDTYSLNPPPSILASHLRVGRRGFICKVAATGPGGVGHGPRGGGVRSSGRPSATTTCVERWPHAPPSTIAALCRRCDAQLRDTHHAHRSGLLWCLGLITENEVAVSHFMVGRLAFLPHGHGCCSRFMLAHGHSG